LNDEPKEEEAKKLILGDDAIESFDTDWFDFQTPAVELGKKLYLISKSSGVCCGIIGSWGSGKSSFMKLTSEFVSNEYPKNVCVTWFTAWDPGGIEDLGDAMLYRLFNDIVEKNKELSDVFKELQEALGVRKSIRERARRMLGVVSKAVPEAGRVLDVADSLLEELDAPRKVQDSFKKLMDWLEKKDRTIFFFIDDIDRATGEQIRDLLSELKVYISHRRIVAVLGYDEDYIINALKAPTLPEGIDPNKYIEKIVTIKINLPLPSLNDQMSYASSLLKSMLDLDEKSINGIARFAVRLSLNNPRRLKNLILPFASALSSINYKERDIYNLLSIFIASAAATLGLILDDNIREAFDDGVEENIISSLREIAPKIPLRTKEIETLIELVNELNPHFNRGAISDLRLSSISSVVPRFIRPIPPSDTGFNWNVSLTLTPILSNATAKGFKIPFEIVESSTDVVIPANTKIEFNNLMDKEYFKLLVKNENYKITGYILSYDEGEIIILLTSLIEYRRRISPLQVIPRLIESCYSNCVYCVSEKNLALWIIDDKNILSDDYVKQCINQAKVISKSLKHSFVFQYTSFKKIELLIDFLLKFYA